MTEERYSTCSQGCGRVKRSSVYAGQPLDRVSGDGYSGGEGTIMWTSPAEQHDDLLRPRQRGQMRIKRTLEEGVSMGTWPFAGLIVVTIFALAGCTGNVVGTGPVAGSPEMIFPGKDWAEATPESQGVDSAKLEKAMRVLADIGEDDKDGTPHTGTTRTVVIRNGRMIWKGSDIDAVQPVFSCTKSLTSSVFGLLVDDGKCTPSTLACEAYPALAEHYPRATLGHFASLTSGYSVPWRKPWLEIRPPDFLPGEAMHYNGAAHMLAYVLQRLAGESMTDLWRKRFARPIGIPDDAWNWTVVGEIEGTAVNGGASGMELSARQMARFGHLYLNKGRWGDKQILSENWVEQSTVPQVAPHTRCFQRADIWYNVLPGRYGYLWWTNGIGSDGKRFWENAPDGTFFAQGNRNNYCIVVPEWNLVLVHLDRGKAISSRLYDKVFAALREAIQE